MSRIAPPGYPPDVPPRSPRGVGVGARLLVIALTTSALGAFAACGGTDLTLFDRDLVADAGDATTEAGGGIFAANDGSSTGADATIDAGDDSCGQTPCASHAGSKDFVEPGAPANASALFGGSTAGSDPTRDPAIRYPNDETMFPINVPHIRHEWSAGGVNDLFRLRFVGPKTTVTVYTSKLEWEPTEEQWDWIAESNRGSAVTLTVEGLNIAAPALSWRSKSITLLYSASAVEGAIYYWSTGTAGVMKALVSDRFPQKFYSDPKGTDGNKCVGCHTLSRDGKRLAVGYDGERLREVSVPSRQLLVPSADAGPPRESSWTTFSPDGRLLLVAAKGDLTLIDADTGATVGPNKGMVTIPAGKVATHPDWSALGDRVVITLGTKGGGKDVENGSIAILPYNDGAWGAPTVVVASEGTGPAATNNFFPVFSPDSKWIAYVQAKGKSKDATSAIVRVVPAAGGAPIDLPRLNGRVNNADGIINVGNSMPTWAPSTRPGIFWLAFSSIRAYGTVRPADPKLDQIWIAAFDGLQPNPAYAAFWAPFQSLPDGNHRAFWTHVEGDKQCGCTEICGDGLDNDCDGVADEGDCQTCRPAEICGNGLDDNCDCVADNCGSVDPDPVN